MRVARMLAVIVTIAASLFFSPCEGKAQCVSGDPIDACSCLTMFPESPQVGDLVSISIFTEGQQRPIDPPDEPVCFWAEGDEFCLFGAEFDESGAMLIEWSADVDDYAQRGGHAWVRDERGFLAEAPLLELSETGVSCSVCAGECETPPEPPEPPACDPADTHCGAVTAEGPDGEAVAGLWLIRVDGSDDAGEEVLFSISLQREGALEPREVSQRGNGEFEVALSGGQWTVSASVDDNAFCTDEADDAQCADIVLDVSDPDPELTHSWCLNDGVGLEAVDLVGGLTAELVNLDDSAWTLGRTDGADTALRFDGADAWLALGGEGDFISPQDFTWSAWIRTSSDGTIIAWSAPDDYWDEGDLALFVREGLVQFDVGFVGVQSSTLPVDDGEWHHVVVTVEYDIDGFSESLRLYIDGVLDGDFLQDMEAAGQPGGILHVGFGSMDFPDTSPFTGTLDDVRVWNFALSEDEVIEVFEAPNSDCPAAPDPDCDGADTHCVGITAEGPAGTDQAGLWTITVDGSDENDDPINYVLSVVNEADPDRTLERRQRGEGSFDVPLRAGTWLISASVDDRGLCAEIAEDAVCGEVEIEVTPRPTEVVAAFCFEDDDDEFTDDVVNGIGAELLGVPEDAGDGPPVREDGLVSDTGLLFDGLDDAMAVEAHPLIDGSNDFTLACWIQVGPDPETAEPDRFAGNIAMLGPQLGESGDAPGYFSLFVWQGKVILHVVFCCGDPVEFEDEIAFVADEDPHHVALAVEIDVDGDIDRGLVYVDGELAGELMGDFQGEGAPETWPLTIGHSTPDWPSADFPAETARDINHFNGVIDNVEFWSGALAEDRVRQLFEEPDSECESETEAGFRRGDVDRTGDVAITDGIFILNWLFMQGPEPACVDSADADDDGSVLLTDGVFLLNFLFAGGPPLAEPTECGIDPTPEDELGCETPVDCG